MEAYVEEVFEEGSIVMVNMEEEGLSSCVGPDLTMDLYIITNMNAQTCCCARGAERSISMRSA